MVGEDYVRPVADKEIAVNLHAGLAKRIDFLHECERIENYTVTDDTTAAGPQHATRNELQDELLPLNCDGMSRVVSAGIARNNAEAL